MTDTRDAASRYARLELRMLTARADPGWSRDNEEPLLEEMDVVWDEMTEAEQAESGRRSAQYAEILRKGSNDLDARQQVADLAVRLIVGKSL